VESWSGEAAPCRSAVVSIKPEFEVDQRGHDAIAALRAETFRDTTEHSIEPDRSGGTAPEAARRQLTVMFVDLIGSTALSARLDPEELRDIIGAYHRRCAEVITSSGGFVAKYLGDGVLAYFGYPQAHEEDAERAVRAGLALLEALAKLDAGQATSLQVRVGIAAGLVVVGDLLGEGTAEEQAVIGGTPNLAARLQRLAEPNTVVIADNTRRMLGGLFDYRDLGTLPVAGIDYPVHVWRVLGASLVGSRFEALGHGRELAVEREMGKSRNSASSGMARKGRFSSASTTLPISLILPVGRIRGVVVIADRSEMR
jgi:class 3 adenylate cyclase